MHIRIDDLPDDAPKAPQPSFGHILVDGFTAPVEYHYDGNHIVIAIREGGILGEPLTELSRKLAFAPDKVRELKEKKETRL